MDLPGQILNKKAPKPKQLAAWLLLFLVATACYLTGLDSLYLPSNGDEMVYSRIARLTATSGHWLPLVSDLDHMRNTKPPLLFWQAMAAGDWGQHWTLTRLRLPAVMYSLLLALLTGAGAWLLTRQRATAVLAACVYLAFFSSFRYGRPYLTSAAETYWLGLPMAWLLWRDLHRNAKALPGWGLFTVWGLLWGVGLAYKSFALVAPTAASFWLMLLILQHTGEQGRASQASLTWISMWKTSLRVAWSAVLAVGVFGLWFALDPDPAAVWQEFVVGENAGKLAREAWGARVTGTLVQALAPLENAGPLALLVLGLALHGLRSLWRRGRATGAANPVPSPASTASLRPAIDRRWTLALLAWLLVWVLVFCIPSQRSARYIIPAMPALAILLAVHWQRLARGWFVATLWLCLPVLLLLGRIAQALYGQGVASGAQALLAGLILGAALAATVAGFLRPAWTRGCSLVAAISLYALLNATLAPLSGPAGQFDLPAQTLPPNARIAVPSTFNAQYERFQFLLPDAASLRIQPFTPQAQAPSAQLAQLLATHDAVVWQQTGAATEPPCRLLPPATCRLLAERWDIKSRHQPGEIRPDNLIHPGQWLLRREWLLTAAR